MTEQKLQQDPATASPAEGSQKHEHDHGHGAEQPQEQMCCDGSGRTAAQHRAESENGKCCVDG